MVLNTIVGIIAILCMLWVIIDVFTNNKRLSTGMKAVWTVLAIVFSIITAVLYYAFGRDGKLDFFK